MKPPNASNDYLELFVDDAGEHRWRRRDGNNHEIVATSGEGYAHKEYAEVAGVAYNPGHRSTPRRGRMTDQHDTINWHAHARVDKYAADQLDMCRKALGLNREPIGPELLAFCAPADSIEADGNLLTTAGLAKITGLIIAAGGQGWDATHARIGVGDTATAAAIGDTDLGAAAGSTHRQFSLVDTISRSNGVITAVATFGTTLANFHWQEWCIDNGTGAGTTVTATMMNHKVTDLGTKTSAASWVFTVTITIT